MDRFLEKFNFPRLNQEEIDQPNYKHWNWVWDKKSPKKQKPRTKWLHRRILSNIREELMPILLKFFQRISEKRLLPNSFYEATITLISKSDKDNTQKRKLRPISLMIIDAKILNKILANRIQQYIKKLIHHDQVGCIPGI